MYGFRVIQQFDFNGVSYHVGDTLGLQAAQTVLEDPHYAGFLVRFVIPEITP